VSARKASGIPERVHLVGAGGMHMSAIGEIPREALAAARNGQGLGLEDPVPAAGDYQVIALLDSVPHGLGHRLSNLGKRHVELYPRIIQHINGLVQLAPPPSGPGYRVDHHPCPTHYVDSCSLPSAPVVAKKGWGNTPT